MLLVFEKVSLLVLLWAKVIAVIGGRTLVTSAKKTYILSKIERWYFIDINKHVEYMNFSCLSYIEPDIIDGDYKKSIEKYVDELYKDYVLFDLLQPYFPNIKKLTQKAKVYIYNYVGSGFTSQARIIYWLEHSVYKNWTVVNFIPMRPGMKYLWDNSKINVITVLNYTSFFVLITLQLLIGISSSFKKHLKKLLFYRNIEVEEERVKKDNICRDKTYEVLFFPHYGFITQGGHPAKDYFYSKDTESPFHPSNILHLDYDKRTNISEDTQYIKEFLDVNCFDYRKLALCNLNIVDILLFTIKLIIYTKWLSRGKFSNKLILISCMAAMYIGFIKYRNSIVNYKDAKIALVGYDQLLPLGLALALEHYNIRTIAAQERFVSSLKNNNAYILDTQLVISDFSLTHLKDKDSVYIDNMIPVGQVRTDSFFDKLEHIEKSYELRVIFLDYHIVSESDQQFQQELNWNNDIKIRNDILSLAENYPNIEFVFRGKNYDWFSNEFHSKVIRRTKKLRNVIVDTNYDDSFRSYHLCSSADLIIARPTSLAEECMSNGMNVIVLDYGINYESSVSRWMPDLLQGYYCHSLVQLNEMFDFFVKNKTVIPDEDNRKIRKNVFSNLTDGKVKERIQYNLNLIYSLQEGSE